MVCAYMRCLTEVVDVNKIWKETIIDGQKERKEEIIINTRSMIKKRIKRI